MKEEEKAVDNEIAEENIESETQPHNDSDVSEPKDTVDSKSGSKKRIFLFGGIAALILLIAGVAYWLYARQYESTDDAFIEGDIVQISPKVPAYVSKIYVNNNQKVKKGDLLVELDPKDIEIKLEQAKAQLATALGQRGEAMANSTLTKKTTDAAKSQATSNVNTARSNIEQTRLAASARRAQVTQANAAVATAKANLAQTKAQIPKAQSDLTLAQTEYNRRKTLFDRGDISKQALDQATNNLAAANSALDLARRQIDAAQSRVNEANAAVTAANETYRQSVAQVNVTESQANESSGRLADADAGPERVDITEAKVGTADAQIQAAEAAVHAAEQELAYTKIYAPEDGWITKKTIEEGQLVQVGAPLMAISQSSDVWVVANFKETQLENMRVGQTVEIKVDAYPNDTFKGKVESFQAGTGSRFSVLPPENATGNFVKVVQRVPVKIIFDQQPDNAHLLAPGMSVEPVVKVR